MDDLKKMIREIPDFPKPGILFYDITTLLRDRGGFRTVIDRLTEQIAPLKPDYVLGIEARGFIFAPALAYNLGAGFVPVRKPKKLPGRAERITYDLEYGTDTLEIHHDAISQGARVVIADDLLATGGTSLATAQLAEKVGGTVIGMTFVVELEFLNGRDRLDRYNVSSLIRYQS
ncbi:MAG TPA: adenine phosphoribosyltransferase [Terriglobia bacterium]|nr:adenine phosphoribosyltransferase [Terriglobia bacterium]